MKVLAWTIVIFCLIAIPLAVWFTLRRHAARRRASEARGLALVAEAARALAAAKTNREAKQDEAATDQKSA